jgi:hypothetical protein
MNLLNADVVAISQSFIGRAGLLFLSFVTNLLGLAFDGR